MRWRGVGGETPPCLAVGLLRRAAGIDEGLDDRRACGALSGPNSSANAGASCDAASGTQPLGVSRLTHHRHEVQAGADWIRQRRRRRHAEPGSTLGESALGTREDVLPALLRPLAPHQRIERFLRDAGIVYGEIAFQAGRLQLLARGARIDALAEGLLVLQVVPALAGGDRILFEGLAELLCQYS
jgi:hypothetical protein